MLRCDAAIGCSVAPASDRMMGPVMKQDEVVELLRDIERSMEMRRTLHEKLSRQEDVDLVEEWNQIEQLDLEIAGKIRKRRLE
jgi:hypothetical protein